MFGLFEYAMEACSKSRDEFAAAYGYPFLIVRKSDEDKKREASETMPLAIGRLQKAVADRNLRILTKLGDFRALPIVGTGALPSPRGISVGRTDENDVPITDSSVSKVHAYFRDDGGDWFLTDDDSRNGTLLNSEQLVAGKPAALTSGDEITFGKVVARYLDAGGLHDFISEHLVPKGDGP
jgi:hypothetical protein